MMDCEDRQSVPNIRLQTPRFILDAGGETATVLSGSLHRCVAEIGPDEVLEVISPEPSSRTEIPEWCRLTGNELLHMQVHDDDACFWIRKRVAGTMRRNGVWLAAAEGTEPHMLKLRE